MLTKRNGIEPISITWQFLLLAQLQNIPHSPHKLVLEVELDLAKI